MSRYIDADALLEKYNVKDTNIAECLTDKNMARAFERFCIIADAVEEQPTVDAVPVVRCKECKRWGTPIPIEMEKDGYGYCGVLWTNTHENEYCAWGERKSNEQQS